LNRPRSTSSPKAHHNPFPQELHTTYLNPKMASNLPLEIGSTIQSASINRAPSPSHDLNPSTTASQKIPVKLSQAHGAESEASLDKYAYDDDDDGIDEDDEEDIPYDVLRPVPRRGSFPPLPDLRFEQSYLASISKADTWWKVGLITVRDQVCYQETLLPHPTGKHADKVGLHAPPTGHGLVPHTTWLALLEPHCNDFRVICGCEDTSLVV
jgi:hypothetical protein